MMHLGQIVPAAASLSEVIKLAVVEVEDLLKGTQSKEGESPIDLFSNFLMTGDDPRKEKKKLIDGDSTKTIQ